jgi:hypothetical protein
VNKNDLQDKGNLGVLLDVQLPVSIRFGETEMVLEEIVKLGVGSSTIGFWPAVKLSPWTDFTE